MKYVGAHVSTAGGVDKAPAMPRRSGAAFALFTRNSGNGVPGLIARRDRSLPLGMPRSGYTPAQVLAHDSYLINSASGQGSARQVPRGVQGRDAPVQALASPLAFHPAVICA